MRIIKMSLTGNEDSKAFVREMRELAKKRDLASIQKARQQMQEWMQAHPHDVHVGTALEEITILEEAAELVALSIAKAS